MESIQFGQKEEADRVVEYGIFGMKDVILHKVDQEIVALEIRLEIKMNEACQNTASHLQEIKDSVAVV